MTKNMHGTQAHYARGCRNARCVQAHNEWLAQLDPADLAAGKRLGSDAVHRNFDIAQPPKIVVSPEAREAMPPWSNAQVARVAEMYDPPPASPGKASGAEDALESPPAKRGPGRPRLPIKHGTVWAYRGRGCRCDLCTTANSDHWKQTRARRKAKEASNRPNPSRPQRRRPTW